MGSIRFAGDLSPLVAMSLVIGAAALVVWLYLRETRQIESPYNYLIPGLRAAAVALAVLILAGPVLHRRVTVGTLGRVIFAVDASQSMSLKDDLSGESRTRLSRAFDLLSGDKGNPGWLESLQSTHELDVVTFSEGKPAVVWSSGDEAEIPTVWNVEPNGKHTDLSSVISVPRGKTPTQEDASSDDQTGLSSVAVVVISDGRSNLGESPIDAAEVLLEKGGIVHSVGMGSRVEPVDIGVVDVIRPETVSADGVLSGEVIVKTAGLGRASIGATGAASTDQVTNADQDTTVGQGKSTEASASTAGEINVRIESGQQTIWSQRVSGSEQLQSVPFVLDVQEVLELLQLSVPRGVQINSQVLDLRAVVDKIEGDSYSGNDSMPFRVAASTRARKLLILDGSSRWEIRYLRNLFGRDPAWSVDSILFGPGTDHYELPRGDQPGEFPDNNLAMSQYDAIILGEIPPDQLDESDASRLREFVRRGGGFIVLDGRYGRIQALSESLLPELVPIQYETDTSPFEVKSLQPTSLGADQSVLGLWGKPEEQDEFWEKLPPPIVAPMIEPQPDAEVLAEAIGDKGESAPWLVTRLYGAGRVFYLSTDQTWRWRYKVADRFHSRFWNQLLASAMQPPYAVSDQYASLGTDEIEYETGQSATIRVRLQGAGGDAIGDATVDALLLQNDQVVASVPLSIDDPDRGTYRGKTLPLDSGAYQVRIQASGFDSQALQASTPIWVGSRDAAEMSSVGLDVSLLEGVADAGSGVYFHETEADQLLETLRPLSSGTVIESDVLLWQSYYWFVAILLLLAVEWWLRKRVGLV
ncbi:MAG: hypothetical protein ISQ09_08925 [Rubripirellula sp.]|nr:hypothetical protein [Rubripirellula sp.]